VSDYRTFRLSSETWPDTVAATWAAGVLNDAEGNSPGKATSREMEAWGRICREWLSVVLSQVSHHPDFPALVAADWRCPCGSSGIGSGGLSVIAGRVTCQKCRQNALAAP